MVLSPPMDHVRHSFLNIFYSLKIFTDQNHHIGKISEIRREIGGTGEEIGRSSLPPVSQISNQLKAIFMIGQEYSPPKQPSEEDTATGKAPPIPERPQKTLSIVSHFKFKWVKLIFKYTSITQIYSLKYTKPIDHEECARNVPDYLIRNGNYGKANGRRRRITDAEVLARLRTVCATIHYKFENYLTDCEHWKSGQKVQQSGENWIRVNIFWINQNFCLLIKCLWLCFYCH